MFQSHNSLSARLGVSASAPASATTRSGPRVDFGAVEKVLKGSSGSSEISIKGAGANLAGNVVDVKGLAPGTTAADVEVSLFAPFFSSPIA